MALDSSGNLYFADQDNNRVRKVTPAGVISTIAGTGTAGYNGEGTATSAQLNYPFGIAVDAAGNVYIADQGNSRIRKVTVATGIISTVAGNGSVGFAGDGGQATSATLSSALGVAVDPAGNLFIADKNRIRRVTP
jgi:DNA-binding beta-propeller fold protein YncE